MSGWETTEEEVGCLVMSIDWVLEPFGGLSVRRGASRCFSCSMMLGKAGGVFVPGMCSRSLWDRDIAPVSHSKSVVRGRRELEGIQGCVLQWARGILFDEAETIFE